MGFDHALSMEAAMRVMDGEGLRPATIKELPALGARMVQSEEYHPLHWKFPIPALGSRDTKGKIALLSSVLTGRSTCGSGLMGQTV